MRDVPKVVAWFSTLRTADQEAVLSWSRSRHTETGSVLQTAGQEAHELSVLVAGEALTEEQRMSSKTLLAGDCFGLLGFCTRSVHEETVRAQTPCQVASLSHAILARMQREVPELSGIVRDAMMGELAARLKWLFRNPLAAMTGAENVDRLAGETCRACDLLEDPADGALLVAARVGPRAVSLNAEVRRDQRPVPITTRTGEGREIYRRSAGLALLEAARGLNVDTLRLGPSISSGRVILIEDKQPDLLPRLQAALDELVSKNIPFQAETWSADRALSYFEANRWQGAAALLNTWSLQSVELLCCGQTRALGPGPLLTHTGKLEELRIQDHPQGLLLDFGGRVRTQLAKRPYSTLLMEAQAPRFGAAMAQNQIEWLKPLGIHDVGSFNEAVVSGKVRDLIWISEGFHEKHIAEIANAIKSREGIQLVAVAGPSASGKTTFIRRLKIQLEVNGIHPLGLSLDNYYRSRSEVPRDKDGKLDLEVLEALDVGLLQKHLTSLLAGKRVATARYDFRSGTSHPSGGESLQLGPHQVLLVEGIHALNPKLLASQLSSNIFRIFVHPSSALRFDRLTIFEPSDLRLIRRIVRDRHQRGFSAADNLSRWPSVRRGERTSIFPHQQHADWVFDSSLVYEPSILRVYAERYLLEVPRDHGTHSAARRLRQLLGRFVPIHPDSVPPTSLLREFIGGSGFSY